MVGPELNFNVFILTLVIRKTFAITPLVKLVKNHVNRTLLITVIFLRVSWKKYKKILNV